MVGRSKQISDLYDRRPITSFLMVSHDTNIVLNPIDTYYRWLAVMGMHETLNMLTDLTVRYGR